MRAHALSPSGAAGASLPSRYSAWLDEALGATIPEETEATCDDCAMCPKAGEKKGRVTFEPDVKCCTYVPHLANFLVGGILHDPDPSLDRGRDSMLERIRGIQGVTPLGVSAPRDFKVRYAGRDDDAFGRDASLLCPHYIEENGQCGIWKHRNAVCTTWFCKHVRGKVGGEFWLAIKALLGEVEQSLSLHCATKLDIPVDIVAAGLTANAAGHDASTQHQVDPAHWGPWAGRVEDYFERCDELVRAMSWGEVVKVGGARTAALVRLIGLHHGRLTNTDAPIALRVGRFEVVKVDDAGMLVSTYSQYDPVQLTPRLVKLLPYFEGQPMAECLAAIREKEGVELEPEVVRSLADFGVLTDPMD